MPPHVLAQFLSSRFFLRWVITTLVISLVVVVGCSDERVPAPAVTQRSDNPHVAGGGPVAVESEVRVMKFDVSTLVQGRPTPLGVLSANSRAALEITLSLDGHQTEGHIELRVGDMNGNGIFRESRKVQINGVVVLKYKVPAPSGGWQPGSYMVVPIADNTVLEGFGFRVK